MSFHELNATAHELLTDNVNWINLFFAAILVQLNILSAMHELSEFARDITPIISALTAIALFSYNLKKIFSDKRKKDK